MGDRDHKNTKYLEVQLCGDYTKPSLLIIHARMFPTCWERKLTIYSKFGLKLGLEHPYGNYSQTGTYLANF